MNQSIKRQTAIKFIILMGIISLFADITYEGARSIIGQYLAVLGASGTIVGTVAGLGELIGYGLRLASGYLSDKTRQYWSLTFVGYTVNLLAVPLIALAGNWPLAATLIIFERLGKAIRTPARDAMLSYATKEVGRGWGFGLHEAMDQIGAILGPLIVSMVLYLQGSYRLGFALLLIPACCALAVLIVAYSLYPRPQDLEIEHPGLATKGFSKTFWLYIAAVSSVAFGYVDFPLIAFHFEKKDLVPDVWVPIFFSIAMGADGIGALICGKLFDKKGLPVLVIATAISALFAPLVFLDDFYFALLGMVLWGIGLGVHESIMRAIIANLVSMRQRGTAYGILNIWFGISWFLGSALLGYLYDISIITLVIVSLAFQLAAIPLLLALKNAK